MTVQVLLLVLLAALIHATWNTWLKLSGDRLVAMSLMGTGWALFAAAWLPFVGLPAQAAWPYLAVSIVVHLAYTGMLIPAYRLVDLSVAYPMIRGTGPIVVTLVSVLALDEHIGVFGVLAVLMVTAGVVALGWHGARGSVRALAFGALGGALLATYTLLDGVGARAGGSPHAYAAWLFFLTGLPMLAAGVAVRRGRFVALARPVAGRGLAAGALACSAFWIVIWALSRAPMGLVAAGRETSVVFVALASAYLLKEKVSWLAIGAVFLGIVFIRIAGA